MTTLHLPPAARAWAPGARRIVDGLPLGERADRTPLGLPLWTKSHGMRHPLMGGASGSGKTNTLNVITCGLAACGDTVIWAIEVAKAGQGQAPWVSCFDWLATTLYDAVNMLEAAVAIIDARSRVLAAAAARGKGDDKVMPTIDLPALIIMIDEAAALFGIKTGNPDLVELSARATELARQVAQTGRSACVGLLVATQRPTVAALGDDGDLRSQLHPNLCLRMNRRADVGFVLQNVDLDTVDTTLFNVPGLLYVQDGPDVDPLPIRSYALFEPKIVHRLARILSTGRPALDPVAPATPPGNPPPALPTRSPYPPAPPPDRLRAVQRLPAPVGKPTTRAAARARNGSAIDAARAAAAELPEVARIPLADLSPDEPAGPPDAADALIAEAITTVLAAAGPDGMGTKEITAAVAKLRGTAHRGSVHRAIRTLIDTGDVRSSGARNRYRYHLTTTARSNAA